jgi:hypothetical protein
MQSVLRRQLNRRLDDLFVVTRYEINYLSDDDFGYCAELSIPDDTLQRQMFSLFGEPDIEIGSYHFSEPCLEYDEPFCVPKYIMYPVRGFCILADLGDRVPCYVASSNFRRQRFVGWLSRRYSQLLTAEASQ